MHTIAVKAAVYARISHDADADGLGVARQKADCLARAKRDGLTVVDIYIDNDISASSTSNKHRPEYSRMLEGARAGLFDVVLAYSNSRLTRRPRELEDLIDLHDRHGTKILTIVSGDDDLGTADGRMMARLKASVDAGEAERTAERLRSKMLELAKAGRHTGPRPFGWDLVGTGKDQQLVINDAEASTLRECVQQVLAGDSIWKIANDLNSRGILTSKNNTWKTQVLRRVLLRESNAGFRRHQPTKNGKPFGHSTRYKAQWDPIIEEGTHDRVVAKLTDPSRRTNNRGTEPIYLLTSIARCGECGGYLVGVKDHEYEIRASYARKDGTRANPKKRLYPAHYKCPTPGCHKVTRLMSDMDDHVTGAVIGQLEAAGIQFLGGDPVVAKHARERVDALEAKLALAADQWADGGLGMTDEQLRRVNERIRPQLEAERARLSAAHPSPALAGFTGPGVVEKWEKADLEIRKMILRELKVIITAHRVGPGNGTGKYVPSTVSIEWLEPAGNVERTMP